MRTKAELLQDVDQLERDVERYFADCERSRDPRELKNGDLHVRQIYPTLVGLARHLKIHRNTLYRLLDDIDSTDNADSELQDAQYRARDILVDARQRVEDIMLQATLNGDAQDRVALAMLVKMGAVGAADQAAQLIIRVEGGSAEDVSRWSQ